MEAFGGLIAALAVLFCVALGVGLSVFWIWMLVLAIQNKGLSDGEKVGWVLAIVFFHFIGHPKRHASLLPTVAAR